MNSECNLFMVLMKNIPSPDYKILLGEFTEMELITITNNLAFFE